MEVVPTDQDLVHLIRSMLETRVMPVNYESLYDLVRQGPPQFKTFVEQNYADEKFLNFLLSHADFFSVNSDGTVTLIGGTEYVFPQGIDVVDSIACVSDESYFGDREEYISDTDEDEEQSINSIGSARNLLAKESSSNTTNDIISRLNKRGDVLTAPNQEINIYARTQECPCDESTSSDSSQDYLSSESESGESTTSGSNSQSSFASCPEVEPGNHFSDSSCLFANSSSSTYSSCSES